jgi:PAS domain S-box-containing protein
MKRTGRKTHKAVGKKEKKKSSSNPARTPGNGSQDVRKLVQLLQVNQVELEHQNQELRIAEEELEASRNRYVNLFDFSPVPYITLDGQGVIKEVNLGAGKMLGVERKKLIGKRFTAYIASAEKEAFSTFLKNVFDSPEKQSCKVSMMRIDKGVLYVLLEGVRSSEVPESGQICLMALIDLTGYGKPEDSMNKSI